MNLDELKATHYAELHSRSRSADTFKFYDLGYKELARYLADKPEVLADINKLTKIHLLEMQMVMRRRGMSSGGGCVA